MRLKTVLIGVLLLPLFGYSQMVSSHVTNLAGTEALLGRDVITVSIGEPAIATLQSDHAIVTQGFLQPEILPCEQFEFRYFPNPATDFVTLQVDGCEMTIASVMLTDLWGRILYNGKLSKESELYVGDLSQGMYVVDVSLSSGVVHRVHLIKIAE